MVADRLSDTASNIRFARQLRERSVGEGRSDSGEIVPGKAGRKILLVGRPFHKFFTSALAT